MGSAKRPYVGDKVYHLMVERGRVPRHVLLPGDPGRVPKIASYWDESTEIARNREFVTYVGRYKGIPIAATSTGIGSGSTAIAVEELLAVGADTFIRVGTTGALRREIRPGDVIIATGAVRWDGASRWYAPPEYPAVAHWSVVSALVQAAQSLGVRYHVGIVASTDSFYVGQERPGYGGFLPPWARGLVETLRSLNVLSFEMESATIFTLASIYGAKAGGVYAAIANRETDEFVPEAGVEDAIKVANEAVKILAQSA
ncbi:uridine phosphorylase [Thermoproteus tenax]|uniref:Uridine phosphorylase n=1 Tax=Thermoproteus tenax (strain ATCC 35583 / DSM 2078 / JCM 9277 / NBRC 100435 / Kra 1) TaxID=768679 RepID=G4RLH7_THETK|nr:uridine phosphorylase [Thermoproteus tenax]CCC82422.1 Uridine phosphorylase [Thermoproteus tenax Kra 1]